MKTFEHGRILSGEEVQVGHWVTSIDWWSGWYEIVEVTQDKFAIISPVQPGKWLYFNKRDKRFKAVAKESEIPNGDLVNRVD